MTARAPARSLAGPLGLSALLHAAAVTGLLVLKAPAAPPAPPMYKVELVAAPAGPRAVGVVGADPGTEAPPPPKAAVTETEATVGLRKTRAEARTPRRATPNVTPTPRKATGAPPRAGGGPVGGTGTDVAGVRTEGIAFPFPGYLQNVVRQIALEFTPDPRNGALRAELFFLVRRDGSVAGVRFLTRSGSYAFDLECQGAVEAVGARRAFGPLPAGFSDDVLPIVFTFDPRTLR